MFDLLLQVLGEGRLTDAHAGNGLASAGGRREWQRGLQTGATTVDADPFRLDPVVRVHHENGNARAVDRRSG